MAVLSIIADDLTGACDTGAVFAHAGRRTMVILDAQRHCSMMAPQVEVVVYNTESRYLSVEQSTHAVISAAQQISAQLSPGGRRYREDHHPGWVYKKIDSTLRGYPGGELAALMRALGVTRALVAPAFPAQRRTTVGSQILVNGQSLAQTPFATEVASGDLRSVFGGHGYPVHAMGLDEVRGGSAKLAQRMAEQDGISVADAETDDDLNALTIAAQACGIQVLCGSAGLARRLPWLTHAGASRSEVNRPRGPALVIAGSRNPVTVRQVEVARAHGLQVIHVPPGFGDATWVGLSLSSNIEVGRDLLITTAMLADSPLGKDVIAKRLGALAAAVVERVVPGTLVLTGGDVATAVCAALGAETLELLDELQSGIAFGRLADGPHAGLRVITKAGGFGHYETLWQIVKEIGKLRRRNHAC